MSLRWRLLLALLIPGLLFGAGAGGWAHRVARETLEQQVGQNLQHLASVLASQLELERLERLSAEDFADGGSRNLRRLQQSFQQALAFADLKRAVVFDRKGKAVLDVGGGLPFGSDVYEVARDALELEAVWAGKPAHSEVLFRTEDGQYHLTGYAPLQREGAVWGALAVEGTVHHFDSLQSLGRGLGLAWLALGLVGLVWASALAGALARPIERLAVSAERMGAGDLETPIARERQPEVGVLAKGFESMRQSLRERERQQKLMLAGVAHEIRNPLGGMELFAGLAKESLAQDKASHAEVASYVQRVLDQISRLKRIVEEFLSYSKEQKPELEVFLASHWVARALEGLGGQLQARQLSLELAVQEASLRGDVGWLSAGLLNVLQNAAAASEPGQTLSVEGKPFGGGYQVSVVDRGAGIPPEKQKHIMEPFFTTKEQGTGLGLPLTQKWMAAHGGRLSFESRPGLTRFDLWLPFLDGPDALVREGPVL